MAKKTEKKKTTKERVIELWKNADRRVIIAAGAIGALLIIALLTTIIVRNLSRACCAEQGSGEVEYTSEVTFRHPLTGAALDAPLASNPEVFAVMIENSTDAWPLSGLEDAFLVIEAPVEGGIPRFEAFYYEGQDIQKIGPVRSARPYYVDWADELRAMYVHVGGSPDALTKLASDTHAQDFNEFWNGAYFWRDNSRYAPHNVYTSLELLASARIDLEMESDKYDSWKFGNELNEDARGTVSFGIDWQSASSYDVSWDYDAKTNRYSRKQGGNPMTVSDGDTVDAANIAVLETNMAVLDAIGRRSIDTIGEGDAVIFQNGKQITATWKKASRIDRLRFYDKDTGEEISFVPGSTWIEVLPSLAQLIVRSSSDEPIWD